MNSNGERLSDPLIAILEHTVRLICTHVYYNLIVLPEIVAQMLYRCETSSGFANNSIDGEASFNVGSAGGN